MRSNIFLFSWEEKFLVYQEISKWKKSFAAKYWAENIFDYKSDDINPADIMNSIFSWWLFVTRKLLFIWWLPKDTDSDNKINESKYKIIEDKILEKFEQIPDDVVVVFVSFTPDKRTKAYKFISINSNLKVFDKLSEKDQRKFAKDILWDLISDTDLDYFFTKIWSNVFSINNESIKLKIYAEYNKIKVSKQVIDDVVFNQSDVNTFDILDKMFFDKKATISLIEWVQKNWWDNFQFLWMLYWWLKAVIQIMDFYKRWENSSKDLASKLGLHPFVVLKNLKLMPKLIDKEFAIRQFYRWLVELDLSVKTWKLPAEMFWLEIKNLILKCN